MTSNITEKEPNWPCYNCIGLAMCVGKNQFTIAMLCDNLLDYMVDFYQVGINHFGRVVVFVDPLNKKFELEHSHNKKGILIGDPELSSYDKQRRIIINPITQTKTYGGIKLA